MGRINVDSTRVYPVDYMFKKVDEMQQIIENDIIDINEKVNGHDSQLAHKAKQTDVDAQSARIDNIIATAGNGTIPTELSDLRVDSEGRTFGTAGSRVKNIESDLSAARDVLGIGRLEQTQQGDTLYVPSGENNINVAGTSGTQLYITKNNQFTTDYVSPGTVLKSKGVGSINLFATSGSTFKMASTADFFLPKGKYVLKGNMVTVSGTPTIHSGMTYVYAKPTSGGSYTTVATNQIYNGVSFELTTASTVKMEFYISVGAALTADTEVSLQNIMLNFGTVAQAYEEYNVVKQTIVTGQYSLITLPTDSYLYAENGGVITRKYYTLTSATKIELLESEIEELKIPPEVVTNDIVCWGDSLTDGTGATTGKPASDTNSDTSYPGVLGVKLGSNYNVINAGIGGETSWMIAARQGGMPVKVLPTTIPANTSQVRVYLKGLEQDFFYDGSKWTYLKDNLTYNIDVSGDARINPCFINGIEGTLTRTLLTSGTPDPTTGETVQSNTYAYYFSRSTAGTANTFTTPVDLITYASKNYKDAINIIWMGQNDAPNHGGSYITQVGTENRAQAMIDHLRSKKYIVLKYPSGADSDNAITDQSFQQKFGEHFINIRKYLVTYGVQIANELGANITVSPSDQTLIDAGQIPSCLRIDGVHGNYWYYQVVARAVHEKGKDLGYW